MADEDVSYDDLCAPTTVLEMLIVFVATINRGPFFFVLVDHVVTCRAVRLPALSCVDYFAAVGPALINSSACLASI